MEKKMEARTQYVRLDKYLADMQLGTRSEVKIWIRKKRVMVNDEICRSPEVKIALGVDEVYLDGVLIEYERFQYIMLNKPAGTVSATKDNVSDTVLDLLQGEKTKDLFPVGRLDKDTEGLLLLTNDGELAHRLLSPRHHVDKTYYVKVTGKLTNEDVEVFSKGVDIGEKNITMPAKLEILQASDSSEANITIQEGKFHQVKRMFQVVGKQVVYLKRLSMGTLQLDETLKPGQYRPLTKEELTLLKQA